MNVCVISTAHQLIHDNTNNNNVFIIIIILILINYNNNYASTKLRVTKF